MNNEIELRLPNDIRWSDRSMGLPPGLSSEQWLEAGRYLRKARGAVVFWETDWLAYGRKNFGDEKVREALGQLEFEFGEVKAMESLLQLEFRTTALTPEHHTVLAKAKLSGPDQQIWIDTACRQNLSVPELAVSIRKGTVTRIEQDLGGGSNEAGVATFQAIEGRWELLMKQVQRTLAEWTIEDAREAREHIAPIVKFDRELVARFPALGGASGTGDEGGAA